jgi:hypothetical protein
VRFLYVSPEHVTGGFELFIKGHQQRGNDGRWITFFPNEFGFKEDLCFNLHAMPTRNWVGKLRRASNVLHKLPQQSDLAGNPPFWHPDTPLESLFFRLRDLINAPRIERVLKQYDLNDFDIYHFEQGIDPYRDGRWVKRLAARGKGIVCFYHGTDLRNRGVIEAVHKHSNLNLTSEIDLLHRLPGMKYLYLPIDIDELKPNPRPPDGRIRIGHAARNRRLKGSDLIEETVKPLSEKYPIDWVMIENMPHKEALERKSHCDIFIDQITDLGGWGYGASSVESLALGIATVSRINPQVAAFLGEHPFISAAPESLEKALIELIEDVDYRRDCAEKGRRWVIERHGLSSVMNTLYGYYSEMGLI